MAACRDKDAADQDAAELWGSVKADVELYTDLGKRRPVEAGVDVSHCVLKTDHFSGRTLHHLVQ